MWSCGFSVIQSEGAYLLFFLLFGGNPATFESPLPLQLLSEPFHNMRALSTPDLQSGPSRKQT